MLRRRIFLGLTLPQIAACGVAFTFWLSHAAGVSHGTGGERLLAMIGSLVFTLVGMGLLAYLDRHATGSPEGRLAAAYAFASALTILFVVFNPAGELEILNLLKGEVISLSKEELKLLAVVYGAVFSVWCFFAASFCSILSIAICPFLLTGGSVQWSFCCTSCAASASPSVSSWPGRCWCLASWCCRRWRPSPGARHEFFSDVLVALRFVHRDLWFLFVRAFGFAAWADRRGTRLRMIFIVYAMQLIVRKSRGSAGLLAALLLLGFGCSAQKLAPLDVQAFKSKYALAGASAK